MVPRMPGLDWRRALGMQLWYGTPPGASVAEALEAYSAAVAKGGWIWGGCGERMVGLGSARACCWAGCCAGVLFGLRAVHLCRQEEEEEELERRCVLEPQQFPM